MGAGRLLVVGGGIAGLCLRAGLRSSAWEVDLVERDAGVGRSGVALAVQPNAVRALGELGLAEAVCAAGAVVERFQYRNRCGALLCDVDLGELWAGIGPFLGITRSALQAALGGLQGWQVGTAVRSVSQDGAGVSIGCDDGSVARYDLVVGADGVGSAVRRASFAGAGPVGAGQVAWRSVAPTRPDGPAAVQFWLGEDRFFGLCPVGAGSTYGFANLPAGLPVEPVTGRRRRLAGHFADFGAPVREYLAAVEHDDDIHCAPIAWWPETAWYDRRVVLIGDAAHAMSPMLGQGAAMAVEDAVVLAEELGRCTEVAAGLAAFVERRRTRVERVRQDSQALGALVRSPAEARDRALRDHGRAAVRQRYAHLTAPP
jgi:2-polyprenyl-6-methoxyphenol hydroxylase-like FAD-dependent oxidoreductase